MTKHTRAGGSSTPIWTACTGAIALDFHINKAPTIHMATGTVAHKLAEARIEHNARRYYSENTGHVGDVHEVDGFKVEVTEEMLDGVEMMTGHCLALAAQAEDRWATEETVHLNGSHYFKSPPVEPVFGTADFHAIIGNTLHVVDLKTGKVLVEAGDNLQLVYYAMGIMAGMDPHEREAIKWLSLEIVQPHAPSIEGPIRTWLIDRKEFEAHARKIVTAVERIDAGDFTFVTGDHCRWCNAKGRCNAWMTMMEQAIFDKVEPLDPKSNRPAELDADALGQALDAAKNLAAWLKAAEEEAHARLSRGEAVTGYTLKPKRAIRKWTDEAAALDVLRDHGFTLNQVAETKLLSPAKMQKQKDAYDLVTQFIDDTPSGSNVVKA